MVREVDTMLAPLDPGSFGHGSIDLLEIKFALYAFFIDVGNHVRRFDKRHRK